MGSGLSLTLCSCSNFSLEGLFGSKNDKMSLKKAQKIVKSVQTIVNDHGKGTPRNQLVANALDKHRKQNGIDILEVNINDQPKGTDLNIVARQLFNES